VSISLNSVALVVDLDKAHLKHKTTDIAKDNSIFMNAYMPETEAIGVSSEVPELNQVILATLAQNSDEVFHEQVLCSGS
jgi:hypothetical protein